MLRSSDGKMRIDTPNTTVITDPAAQHAIVLDHLTKQAQIVPLQPQAPQMPNLAVPGVPQVPGAPGMPPVAAQDLGKSFIEGHPVDGTRYIVQQPGPQPPVISDVWTSTSLKMPVLTQVTTPAGVQTTYCKPAPITEPDPSLFQVPPGYTVVMPKKA